MHIMAPKNGKWLRHRAAPTARVTAADTPVCGAAEEAHGKWRALVETRCKLLNSISDRKLKASAAKN